MISRLAAGPEKESADGLEGFAVEVAFTGPVSSKSLNAIPSGS